MPWRVKSFPFSVKLTGGKLPILEQSTVYCEQNTQIFTHHNIIALQIQQIVVFKTPSTVQFYNQIN